MEELSKFLNHEIYIDLYETIERSYKDIIEPVSFFSLIEKDVTFFLENNGAYLLIRDYFKKSDLTGRYRYFYFYAIRQWIENEIDEDDLNNGVLQKTFKIITDSHSLAFDALPQPEPTIENGFGFNFTKVKSHLDNISDFNARKKILIDLKTDALQTIAAVGEVAPRNYHTFVPQCDIELKRLDDLLELGTETVKHAVNNIDIAKSHPIFSPDAIDAAENFIKPHFLVSDQEKFILLLKGEQLLNRTKLTFNSNGNRLAQAFRDFYDVGKITQCNKLDLEDWIIKNYNYIHLNKITAYTSHYVNKIISGNNRPSKFPLFSIDKKDGNIKNPQ